MLRSASALTVRNDASAETVPASIAAVCRGEDAVAPRLSPAERRAREDAVRFAYASIGLEGFRVSAEEQAWSDRFVNGEIDLAEFVRGK